MTAIQLYSVRSLLEADFEGTLRRLAAIGYQAVEFAWQYGGLQPGTLRERLDGLGLRALGVYAPGQQALTPESDAYRYAAALGCRYITTGLADSVSAEEWPKAIEQVRLAAQMAADRGLQLLYHNHRQELAELDGRCALDILYAETDPSLVQAELDVAWIVQAGADPVSHIERWAGRLPLLHLKDTHPGGPVTELGRGCVDLPAVVAAARRSGVSCFVYEQDESTLDPVEAASLSFACMEPLLQARS